jgi:hypothetical protein
MPTRGRAKAGLRVECALGSGALPLDKRKPDFKLRGSLRPRHSAEGFVPVCRFGVACPTQT